MSIFRTADVACPSCGAAVPFDLVHSVNATRRPDLRDAVLDGSFQRKTCPVCDHAFRMEPELAYVDVGRGQWIAAWPASSLAAWPAREARSRDAFAAAYGETAGVAARAVGAGLRARVVFGWPALVEKLVVADAAIDDVTVELAKAALVRTQDGSPVMRAAELRLLGVEPSTLTFGWLSTHDEAPIEILRVPRGLLADIEAAPEAWRPLREALTAGPFVDLARLVLAR